MTLRPEYSLGHPDYNAFSSPRSAKKGPDCGSRLTALTRLGFNAWDEAARLSDLPRDAAAHELATTIGRLPEEDCKASEAEGIAARLVAYLPGRSARAVPQMRTREPIATETKQPGLKTWMIWSVVAVLASLLVFALQSNHNIEAVPVTAMPTQQ